MFWHLGILAFWHSGILAFWHFGILAFWHFEILSSFSKGGEACFKKIFPLARAFKDIGTPAPQGDPGAGFSSNLGDRYATEGPRERLVKYFESPCAPHTERPRVDSQGALWPKWLFGFRPRRRIPANCPLEALSQRLRRFKSWANRAQFFPQFFTTQPHFFFTPLNPKP